MTTKRIAVIVGSLRKESFNRKMATNLIRLAPESIKLEILEIGQLQMYNQDDDKAPPGEWLAFREALKQFDGVIFVTPEYNRSVPAALKNAIDIGSRPYGQSAWEGKPAAIMSVSPGSIGGFGANHHLRQSLVFLNMPILQQPEAYVGGAAKLFDEKGDLVVDSTRDFAVKFLQAFSTWVDKFSEAPRSSKPPQCERPNASL
ncbi:MAG: NADPH-dependent FMN reductase [Bdellovibrionales bacterium]